MYYIYQRISTENQQLIRQESAIAEYCRTNNIEVPAENIYSDVITGKTIKREHYQEMKSKLQKDDILILLDLDRLGRSWDIIKSEWKDLTERGVYIIIINCPLINVLPDENGSVSIDKRLIQSIMFDLLCYLSQKEVEKISQRTKEALKAKRENGVVLGHPKTINGETEQKVLKLRNKGYKLVDIAEQTGLSIASVSRIIKRGEL